MIALLSCFAAFMILWWFIIRRERDHSKKYPPAVSIIRLVFDGILSRKSAFENFASWRVKYGGIFQLNLFGRHVIVLNDFKSSKACFSNPNCNGPLYLPFYKNLTAVRRKLTTSDEGIFFTTLERAAEQRNFFLKMFSELGKKSGLWKEQLEQEVSSMIEDIRRKDGQPFEITKYFMPVMLRATWRSLGNAPMDKSFPLIVAEAVEAVSTFPRFQDQLCLWLPDLSAKISSVSKTRLATYLKALSRVHSDVDLQKTSRIPDQPRSIIDAYFDKGEHAVDSTSIFHASKKNIYTAMMDLLAGAVDTSANTMEWLVLYMVHNPTVQEKLQKEIDSVIGRDRLPNLDDRHKLPFTEACVLEVLRLQPLLPFNLPREVTSDTEVNNYFLKKGTVLLTNAVAVNRNLEVYQDPDQFQPDRFLCAETGQIDLEKRKYISTFGTGLRSCPGQHIALDELFMAVASVFQNFSVTSATLPPLQPLQGLLARPQLGIQLAFKPRD